MPKKSLWRVVLIIVLCIVVATPARADTLTRDAALIIIGIVATGIAITVGVAVAVTHYSKKRTLTGCVVSAAGGMSITDEGDKKTYTLSGNTAGITPGNRMKLGGKKLKSKPPDKTLVWDATKVTKDFGVCAQ